MTKHLRYYLRRSSELNALGYVYLCQQKIEDAINTFMLNTKIFPDDPNTYDSLGEAYYLDGQYQNAKVQYSKVRSLDPDNEHARKMIAKVNDALTKY